MATPHRERDRQAFGTEGLPPMERPSRSTRLFMRLVAWAERLNQRCAKLGNRPVFDNAEFPWVQEIEAAFPDIRRELAAVLDSRVRLPAFQDIVTDVRSITDDEHWKVFMLGGYGITAERNIARCPRTWAAVRRIPGFQAAMFSVFEPGKRLPPHRGPYNGVLRLHLGLVVPEQAEQAGIRVGEVTRHWAEGEVLVFDDAFEHEAWNRTEQTRVVLFVDFAKPLRFPASLVNRILLRLAVFTPFIREAAANLKAWERNKRD